MVASGRMIGRVLALGTAGCGTSASVTGRSLILAACLCASFACAHAGLGRRGPRRDEALVISELRLLRQAEVAYRPGNFGYYDVPECLATPARCMPWYQPSGPSGAALRRKRASCPVPCDRVD